MKKFLLIISILFTSIFICNAQAHLSQYIILKDSVNNNEKMLEGIVDKNDLKNDTSFHWYAESQRIYPHPDTSAVAAFKNNKDKIYFLFFGGTWCEDTHFILPKFYKIQEASGFPETRITVFALDRKKNGTGNIAHAMNITRTPTIVVMKDGKELGRLIEYGKTGHWDKELAAIINQ